MDAVKVWLDSCLKDLSTHEAFKNVTKIKEVTGKRLGEEMVVFVSDIYRCSLLLEKGHDTEQFNVIVKMEPQGPLFTSLIKKFGFFETEIMMYEKTLKEMEKLMRENGMVEELHWPVCYFCNDNKLLIQDLNVIQKSF